ncbi:ribonuclease J [Candidatus Mycoplasma haematominutum]|uniref:Ribonuclease J C-terminal domain-containing protein n=1 Tax=Candidatus Mycoplasma haematominutum 'Birmingham 1' TaxID=1116213 RepID=G8C410_9MOLU|nr:ribonuclease J [Candidatus Mycoplasma haematominutum]CCE67058.1 conserved hypothetical protein (Zn-dependenthydrolase) [Candidatus Mycoplasma haematominutum 'Birmingham 1']
MSIKYYSLGGQDERFRYSGVLELHGDVFLLNAGASCVNANLYDIEEIIPDYKILLPLKSRLKGVFIGVPRELNISSIPYLLQMFPNLPIYTNSFGAEIINSFLARFESVKGKRISPKIITLDLVSEHSVTTDVKVVPIKVAATLPNSLAWAFKFSQSEYVVFIDEFVVASENLPCRDNQLNVLFQNLKSKVSLLIIGTQSCATVSTFALKPSDNFVYLKKLVSRINTRLIVAIYLDDWYTIFNLSKIAYIYRYNFSIFPDELSVQFNSFLEKNKLKEYMSSVNELNSDGKKVQIVVVAGTHNTLYSYLRKILEGVEPRLKLIPKDVIIFMTNTFIEKELEEISTINELARNGGEVLKAPSSLVPYMAGAEDIMLLVNCLSPYNVVPVNGFYKDYVEFNKSLSNVMNPRKIHFLENGNYITLDRKNVTVIENEISEVYVSGQEMLDINRNTLFERKLLAQSGVIIIAIRCNNKKNVISKPIVKMMSVFAKDFQKQDEALTQVKNYLRQDLSKYLQFNSEIDNRSLKQTIRKSVYHALDPFLFRKPSILAVISHLH